jgi:hypothetical protein
MRKLDPRARLAPRDDANVSTWNPTTFSLQVTCLWSRVCSLYVLYTRHSLVTQALDRSNHLACLSEELPSAAGDLLLGCHLLIDGFCMWFHPCLPVSAKSLSTQPGYRPCSGS